MTKRWWEFSVRCDAALAPAAMQRLKQLGAPGCAYEENDSDRILKVFLPLTIKHHDLVRCAVALEEDARARGVSAPAVAFERVENCASAGGWPATPVGRRLIVQPAEVPVTSESRSVIRLLPRFGFGINHPTTMLCLAALEDRIRANDRVADVGCGSGILSIAACLLGAGRVDAVDLDPVAADTAAANRDINGIGSERLSVQAGSVETLGEALYDGILCNTGACIIRELAAGLDRIAGPKSWLITSGFREHELEPVAMLIEQAGWSLLACSREDNWFALEGVHR